MYPRARDRGGRCHQKTAPPLAASRRRLATHAHPKTPVVTSDLGTRARRREAERPAIKARATRGRGRGEYPELYAKYDEYANSLTRTCKYVRVGGVDRDC